MSEIPTPEHPKEPREPWREQTAKVHREMAPKARVRRGIPDSPKIKAQEAQAARAQESQESPGNQKCMVLLSKSMVFVKLPISENCNAMMKCSRMMTKTDNKSRGLSYTK